MDSEQARHEALGLTADDLMAMYRHMLAARAFDERTMILERQGKIPFTITGVGHEGAQIGAAWTLRKGVDAVLPYYRDVGVMLVLGMTPTEMMMGEFGRAADPNSGGRQMPKHWGSQKLRVISQSSPVATQIPHAAGLGLAAKLRGEDSISWVSFGDGATSKGDFHEGISFASIHKLPVVFFCENNLYAISVPLERQSPVPNIADRSPAYGIPGVTVDGNDVLEVYRVSLEAAERARRGEGPTLIEARTYRFDPHTTNDDDRKYRTRAEVDKWRSQDPILRFAAYLKEHNILSNEDDEALKEEAKATMLEAARVAEAAPEPEGSTALRYVYHEEEGP